MIYVATATGKQHIVSEDAVLVGKRILTDIVATLPCLETGFVCVADGVGGNAGGGVASQLVLSELAEAAPTTAEQLAGIVREINRHLIQKGFEEPRYGTMATTLTGVFLSPHENLLVHIGNTRACVAQSRYIKQLTTDHTTYSWLMQLGRFEEAEACNRNEIIGCLGGGTLALASRLSVSVLPEFSRLLLTSDGIHEYVDADALEAILNNGASGAEQCAEILNAAREDGSNDDLSVVLMDGKD